MILTGFYSSVLISFKKKHKVAPEVTKDPPVEGGNNVSNNGALSWLTSWYIAPWGWRTHDSIYSSHTKWW